MRLPHPAFLLVAAVGISTALAGCPSRSNPPPALVAVPLVTEAQRSWPDSSQTELELGRTTVVARCNRCHGYPAATEVALEQWPATITRMLNRCTVTPAESRAVTRFLLAQARLAAPAANAPAANSTP
jgi:hypothetical protein